LRPLVNRADRILAETAHERTRFSRALGVDTDCGGWSPFHALTSVAKSAYNVTKKSITVPLKYGYKYGVKAPLSYTYKGVKYVGAMAEKMALAPLRAIVRRFTGTMISRRANLLAKQRGLAAPGPAEKAAAAQWAKGYVRAKGGKYGGAITMLMGNSSSEMGLGTGGTAGLIILGPIGLIALLTGLVKTSSPAAPPPDPGSPEAAAEAAQAAQGAGDGTEDQGTADIPPDYGAQDAGAPDAGAPDAGTQDYGDSSGAGPQLVTIEQLSRMTPKNRSLAQALIQAGRLRLR
jgi:hypothetical protein